jgi:hypothetical protein
MNDLVKAEPIFDLATVQQGGVDEDTKAVAGSGGINKRLSIKGGVFRKLVGGKEIGAIDERFMSIIFVKLAHDPSRSYYAQAYEEGKKISPVCWSSDCKTPDAAVKHKKSDTCTTCQYSVKGSGTNGKGSACRMGWRTAIVLPSDPAGDVMQLVLPATSCFGKEDNGQYPFRPYIQYLAGHKISAGRVITRMTFDTKAPVPKVMFKAVGAVDTKDLDTITAQSKTPAAESAVKMTVFQVDEVVEEVAEVAETETEPVLRKENAPAETTDVADIVKKWGGKKA